MADDDNDKIKRAQIELEKKVADNAVEKYKERIKEQRQASRMAELEDYRKAKIDQRDEKGNPTSTHWDTFWRKNKESLGHSSFTSNYDWRTFMMMLVGDLSLMVAAMNGSIKTSDKFHGMRMLWDERPVLFGVPSTKDIPLPNIEYGVRVTDARGGHKLVIDPLIRTEKEDVLTQIENSREPDANKKAEKLRAAKAAIDDLNDNFKVPVIAWLECRGYTPNPAEQDQYIDRHGQVLTPEIFAELNELSNDPEKEPTLDQFLGQKTDVVLTPRP